MWCYLRPVTPYHLNTLGSLIVKCETLKHPGSVSLKNVSSLTSDPKNTATLNYSTVVQPSETLCNVPKLKEKSLAKTLELYHFNKH